MAVAIGLGGEGLPHLGIRDTTPLASGLVVNQGGEMQYRSLRREDSVTIVTI